MKTLKLILSAIAIGVWTLVFQNLGLIPNIQKVRVVAYSGAYPFTFRGCNSPSIKV